MRPPREPMPVQSVEEAITWLFKFTRPEEYLYAPESDLPDVVIFACDMFWCRPSDFIRRMRRMWEFACGADDCRAYRRFRQKRGR